MGQVVGVVVYHEGVVGVPPDHVALPPAHGHVVLHDHAILTSETWHVKNFGCGTSPILVHPHVPDGQGSRVSDLGSTDEGRGSKVQGRGSRV
eukprot:1341820-Rhodomonas_salina.1